MAQPPKELLPLLLARGYTFGCDYPNNKLIDSTKLSTNSRLESLSLPDLKSATKKTSKKDKKKAEKAVKRQLEFAELFFIGTKNRFYNLFAIEDANGAPFVLKCLDVKQAYKSIKQQQPDNAKQLVQLLTDESLKLRKIHHPFLICYVEAFVTDKIFDEEIARYGVNSLSAHVIQACNDEQTLEAEVQKARRARSDIPLSRIRLWFLQLALALEYIHLRNYVHLNVKPSNIFLLDKDQIILGDFGLPDFVEDCFNNTLKDEDVYFYSPERIQRESWRATSWEDVWCYGVTLYYATTLEYYPVPEEIVSNERKSLTAASGKPTCLGQLVNRLLNKSPESRLSMSEILRSSFFQELEVTEAAKIALKCPANLLNHLEMRLRQNEPAIMTSSWCFFDRALEEWVYDVGMAFEEFLLRYENWNEVVHTVLIPACEEAAKSIRKQPKEYKRLLRVGGASAVLGTAIAVTSLITGIVLPFGLLLSSASAAVICGSCNAYEARRKELKKVKELHDGYAECDNAMKDAFTNLFALLPMDELHEVMDKTPANDFAMRSNQDLTLQMIAANKAKKSGGEKALAVTGDVILAAASPLYAYYKHEASKEETMEAMHAIDHLDRRCAFFRCINELLIATIDYVNEIKQKQQQYRAILQPNRY